VDWRKNGEKSGRARLAGNEQQGKERRAQHAEDSTTESEGIQRRS